MSNWKEALQHLKDNRKKNSMKKSKEEVNYSKGKPKAHCGICEHYYNHKCELVAGLIQPKMWCKLFELKK